MRKWLNRYQQERLAGLNELPRIPLHCLHKTSAIVERKIIQLQKQFPFKGAKRLKREHNLSCSHEAVRRILSDYGLVKKRRKKHKHKKETLLGRCVTDVFPGVKDFGLLEVFRRVYKTGKPEHHPVSIYRDQRITGWRENYIHKLPSGQIVAVYDDISARKRTELVVQMTDQCFRAIANYSYDWEVWISPSGRMLWTNPAATRITGYSIQEIMQMPDYPKQLVCQQDRQRMVRAFYSAVKGSTGNDVRFALQHKDGRLINASMSWQPIFNDEGLSLGHRESIRDINHNQ